MPHLNLIHDAWIPVQRQDGAHTKIRPADLTCDFADNPVIDIGWPRADFRAATLEFLIGLLASACCPSDNSVWRRWHDAPPKPEELTARFAPFETAFDFDGPGPRFLQDAGDMGSETSPISGLLIEQPGANTQKNNADLFVKRGRVGTLGRSTAAVALHALQTFAPAGGAGHRTGLRGGGPLTTLAYMPAKPALWSFIWLNVTAVFDPLDQAPEDRLHDVFPWMTATRVSDKTGAATTYANIHPAQCFWGMPRRIALDFEANVDRLPCDLTGEVEDVIVRQYRTRPYGVNYQNVPHPLTPSYKTKDEWLPVHPQPGGIAYRHWSGLVLDGAMAKSADCIAAAKRRLETRRDRPLLRLYGYDMDNMKARGFVETEMPLLFPPAEAEKPFATLVEQLVEGAKSAASLTIGAIKMARGKEGGGGLDLVREKFFAESQSAFFDTVEQGLAALAEQPDALCQDLKKTWLDATLGPLVRKTFDVEAPLLALADTGDLKALETAVNARRFLEISLAGYGKGGGELFKALGLHVPAQKPKKGGSK